MRIGFVTTSFPRHGGDPAGSFVLGLARALAGRGHTIEVVAPEPAAGADWDGGAAWRPGVRVFGAPYARPRAWQRLFFDAGVPDNLARRPWTAALIPPAVASLYAGARRRSAGWEAVISHWLLPCALIGGLLARRGGFRHLALAHSADVNLLGRLPASRQLARVIVRSADHVGFVSRGLRQEFRGLLGPEAAARAAGRLALTPLGVTPAELEPATPRDVTRRELGLAERFAVLFLGRLVPIKGADVLIDALAGRPGTTLVLAGDGPERAALERRCRERGVDARFRGWVGPGARADLLAACDALAVPSRVVGGGRHEGLPLVVLEGLVAGLPVVATRTGGIPELVEDGQSGLLVAPDDGAGLRAAINRLAGDHRLAARLARGGSAAVRGRDWAGLAGSYEALLER